LQTEDLQAGRHPASRRTDFSRIIRLKHLGTWMPPVVLLVMLLFMAGYPVVLLFVKSFALSRPGQPDEWGLAGWVAAFTSDSLLSAVNNTFSLAAVRVAISTGLAVFFAWIVTRTNTPLKSFIELMLWLGFFLPLLPQTIGWIMLIDSRHGLLNVLLMKLFNLRAAPFDVYSYWGIVWCHLTFSTSARFLLITPAFRAMDAVLEEASEVSGARKMQTVLRITIPLLAPAILAAVALGFIKSLESLEIELILGIPAGIFVLSTKIYDLIHYEPPLYGQATALSSVFLIMIFLLVWIQGRVLRGREFTTVRGKGFSTRLHDLGRLRWVSFAFCMLFILVTIWLPLGALLLGTFMNTIGFFDLKDVWTTRHWIGAFDDPIFFQSLANTLYLAVGASVLGTLFYSVISYVIARVRSNISGVINFLSWLPWALPGVLISLGLVWTFLGSPLVRPIYGTLYALIAAIIIKELPVGTQVLKAGLLQIHYELEEASSASGGTWRATFRRILLPLLRPSVMAVGLIVFISAVREIPAVIFLSTYQTRTISLLMLDGIREGNIEKSAVLGVFLVALIFVVALAVHWLGLRHGSRMSGS
jgi:iron(III) transport system permease protein